MPLAYGSLLLATVMEAALGLPDIPFQVTADYPHGCYRGPGPGEWSIIRDMPSSSCIYNMKGYTFNGVYREVAGIILNTTRPGHHGSLHMILNLSTVPGTSKYDVLVRTEGWAHLSVGDKSKDFWWNPSPGEHIYGPEHGEVSARVATIDSGTPSTNVSIWSSWDTLTGKAHGDGLDLICEHKCSSSVLNSEFYTAQRILIRRVEGGWHYFVTYKFRDDSRKLGDYSKFVIFGNLLDVNIM
ncbi:hypothetical protein Pmar_PMAR018411 [Perkinsus marinus ATCC 50983]|uniref:Uncharacterized protein n=1 Tax=Perkinsus marinus (strain ATCC 50983 / TXsc) TaxID=423536 RepID=C5KP73_PERM5|nr:hypothetical protein Pmar_PMAR018411 [Perkinsus marinus ATCC 50983]EER13720.1 hypothetical protein Pmar_PMAR018411 [Perkinsus marinus ATCC 50983]|eukprot:XP_002781925.1 hypothetical protein Pmar_PMAR018411 [Perkinsus marinus ATCC 50983]